MFTTPFGSVEGLIDSVGMIAMLRACTVLKLARESVTCTWNENPPACVGMPLITPCALMFSPGGRGAVPDKDHVSGFVLPVAASVCEYAVPTFPGAKDVVVIANVLTLMLKVLLLLNWVDASVTCTTNGYTPVVVGVPLSCPCGLRVIPGGGVPDTDQLSVPLPPTAVRFCEYAVPTAPLGSETVTMPKTFKLKLPDTCAPEASVRVTPIVKTPPVSGVPESWPEIVLIAKPLTLGPACRDQA